MRIQLQRLILAGWIGGAAASWGAELPLTRVVLFTSGVGFFERQGEMDGRQTVDLSFETDQVPDVIKSMVVVDEGDGRIQAVTYEARDPIERTLQSFSLDLSDNPTLGALLNRARGVPLRVQYGAQIHTGTILGVETRRQIVPEPRTVVETEYLNLLTREGLRSFPLDALQALEIRDSAVARDLDHALAVLAGGMTRDRRGIRLAFEGQGRRPVRVGYLLEAPVWKTSYRLVLDEEGGFLQGWAHVENMTDEDWVEVDLSLVSGRPISFIQNLYDPIYLSRPVVETELTAVAPPPAYDGVLAAAPPDAPKRASVMRERREMALGVAMMADAGVAEAPAEMNRHALGGAVEVLPGAGETGELFRYPGGTLTVPRRQSAMIPIVNRPVSAPPISIFKEQVHARHPLNGAALTNDSGLFLMQGPVTVFSGGEYAGDARLGDTPQNEERLLSYALDLQCEVKVDRRSQPEEVVSVRIVRGLLEVSRRLVEEAVYRVQNKRDTERTLMIQHPFRPDWELTAPAEGVERSRDEHRIRITLEPKQPQDITVREERTVLQSLRLAALSGDQVAVYIQQRTISPALRDALTRLAALQRERAHARSQREPWERKRQEMGQEQQRIRENMRVVTRGTESFTMWERMLIAQEEELADAHREIERLRTVEREKQSEIEDFVSGLNVD